MWVRHSNFYQYRTYVDIHWVPGRCGVRQQCDVGNSDFQYSAGYIFETFRDKDALLYSNMGSLISFPLIPKYVTLSDVECAECGPKYTKLQECP